MDEEEEGPDVQIEEGEGRGEEQGQEQGSQEQEEQEEQEEEMEVEVEVEAEAKVKEEEKTKQAVDIGIPDSFKSEMYFLIAQMLEADPATRESAEALRKELTENGILQPRFDWKGISHRRTFGDVHNELAQLQPQDHLLKVAYKMSSAHGFTSTRTLLGRKRLLSESNARARPSFGVLSTLFKQQSGVAKCTPSAWHEKKIAGQFRLHKKTLGHLNEVYCLIFDRTGQFVFTGADDNLVKCWRVDDGRLIYTFREASSQISDLAVSHDNRLLAASTCDKVLRVYCLRTGAPRAVLAKHVGMITAINFCPYIEHDENGKPLYYLASTSGDGTVAFWRYSYNENDVAVFEDDPTRYHEKGRPKSARIICSSFSPGGIFYCCGSQDNNVRIYQMNTDLEGPVRIFEEEVHDDRVDSIQWCNQPDLRFVSGSKDGTARIWTFKRQKWVSVVLNMTSGDNQELASSSLSNSKHIPKPQVSSSVEGQESTSSRRRQQQQSQQQQPQPSTSASSLPPQNEKRVTMVAWSRDDAIVVTAVSDCTLKLWDSYTGKLRSTLTGHEDEIYVLEPHPISANLLLSCGHDGIVIIWDISIGKILFKYRNLFEGSRSGVYDAKWSPDGLTVAACDSLGHLIIMGHGHTKRYERLPKELFFQFDYRPLFRDSYHNVLDEQTQVPPHLMQPQLLIDSEGNPYPDPSIQRLVPGREKLSDREAVLPMQYPHANHAQQQVQVVGQDQQEVPEQRPSSPRPGPSNRPEQPSPNGQPNRLLPEVEAASANAPLNNIGQRNGESSSRDVATPRLTTTKVILRENDSRANKDTSEHLERNIQCSQIEYVSYLSESRKEVWFDHDYTHKTPKDKNKKAKGRRHDRNEASRRNQDTEDDNQDDEDEEEEQEPGDEQANSSDDSSILDSSDFGSDESTTEVSSEHSDWGSTDDEDQEKAPKKSLELSKRKSPKNKKKRSAAQKCQESIQQLPSDNPEDYVPSPWLSESMPKKSPYFPQIGDRLVYFKQGHEKYIELVKQRKAYVINQKDLEWTKRKSISDPCFVKIVNINFIIRPPRLCVLKLLILNPQTLRETNETFTIKYHDMNDVVDFLVLYNNYRNSTKDRSWKPGDRILSIIDDRWWKGTVKKVECKDENKASPFLSIFCDWDNGEKEYLSPWDLEALTDVMAELEDGTHVTADELREVNKYQPTEDEWNNIGRETESQRISEAVEAIMSLAIAEPFNFPVDLTAFPEYQYEIEYPMDLNLIKTRLDNRFYRRIAALEYDLEYIASNAASFNKPRSNIVKNAKIITKLAIEIARNPRKTKDDVNPMYHNLFDNFAWSDSDEEEESSGKDNKTPGKKRKRRSSSKSVSPQYLNPKKWKHDCDVLLNDMVKNPCSYPFREPVSAIEFPDYHREIATPMDLSTVRESLHIGDYSSPLDFQKDVQLIFKNSKEFNTDPKSKILAMTFKLEEWFDQHMPSLISDWRKMNRRVTLAKRNHKLKKQNKPPVTKGKGKGKGKGQSNKIKRPKLPDSDEDEDEDEHHDETTEEEEEDDDSDFEEKPSTSKRPVRSALAKPRRRRITSDEDEDADSSEHEEAAATSPKRSAVARRVAQESGPSTSSTLLRSRPLRESSMAGGLEPVTGRRASSRVSKPPVKYEEEDDEEPLAVRRAAAASRASTRSIRNFGERMAAAAANPGVIGNATNGQGNANTRPKRQRKPLRRAIYKYDDDEEEDDLEDDEPLARSRGSKRQAGPANGLGEPSKKRAASMKAEEEEEEEESEDDIPLARTKLSSPSKARAATAAAPKPALEEPRPKPEDQEQQTTEAATASSSSGSKRPVRNAASHKPIIESGGETGTPSASSSEDDVPLGRRRRKPVSGKKQGGTKKAKKPLRDSSEEFDDDDDDDEDFNPKGRKRKSPKKKAPAKTKAKKKQDSYDSNSDFIADSDEDEEEEEEEEEEESESHSEEEPLSATRSRKNRSQTQSRAQPKANSSKRAAQALDSESEHISARRPSRLSNRNAKVSPPSSGERTSGRRLAAKKRSYYEGDEDDDEEEYLEAGEHHGDSSGRENRRPRRAAANKRGRFREVGSSEEDEEGGTRRPNPRII